MSSQKRQKASHRSLVRRRNHKGKEVIVDKDDYDAFQAIRSYHRLEASFSTNEDDEERRISELSVWKDYFKNRSLPIAEKVYVGVPPSEIWTLTALRKLKFGEFALSSLPSEIGCLQNLKYLNLSHNNISSLPASIGKLQRLETLGISYTLISELPKEFSELSALRELHFSSSKRIRSFPLPITGLQNLEELSVARANLSSIPPEIGLLQNLKYLNLAFNPIESLPASIGNLKKLEELHVAHTRITEFAKEFWDLSALKVLYMKGRHRVGGPGVSIPPSIERLKNLEELFLPVADDKSLPKEFGNLKNLKILELYGGSNTKLPESIKDIESLTYLDLRDADISYDFGILKELKNLKFLRIGRLGTEGGEQDLHEDVLNLVKGSNFLGHVDFGLQKGSPELEYALACNRFSCTGLAPYEELRNLCEKLWPRMLSNVDSFFISRHKVWTNEFRHRYQRGRRLIRDHSYPQLSMEDDCLQEFFHDTITPHDAMYKLLDEGRQTFLEILIARNNSSSESYSKSDSESE